MRLLLATVLLAFSAVAAGGPWQQITVPTARQAAANFFTPPAEYGMTLWWYWNGEMTESDILSDLDEIHAHGVTCVTIWAYYGLEIDYLSDTWFQRIQFAVDAARDRGMRVWIADEGSYPSGFAGGAITNQYPQDRMKALVAVSSVTASGGIPVAVNVSAQDLGAWATARSSGAVVTLQIVNGKINWTPPAGTWQITLVEWQYRTQPTRYVNNPGFPKNTQYSMFDFLNAGDTRLFLSIVHQKYQNVIGDEFGKTVLGFRGDEPECYAVPWTDQSLNDFQSSKGYDLTALLPDLLVSNPSQDAHRVQADYWDVWSALFRDNFFKVQADWCAANGMEYIVHLDNDNNMPLLVPTTGDFFRALRYVQVPGVDAIWRQIWPGNDRRFPQAAFLLHAPQRPPARLHRELRRLRPRPHPGASQVGDGLPVRTRHQPDREHGLLLRHEPVPRVLSARPTGGPARNGCNSPCWPNMPTAPATCSRSAPRPRASRSLSPRPISGWATPPPTAPRSPSRANCWNRSGTSTSSTSRR